MAYFILFLYALGVFITLTITMALLWGALYIGYFAILALSDKLSLRGGPLQGLARRRTQTDQKANT